MKDGDIMHENKSSDFSIDHILNRAGENSCSSIGYDDKCNKSGDANKVYSDKSDVNCSYNYFSKYTFQWLNCSRYHPPKVTRSFKRENVQRQPGRHPRIPFTSVQLETLERSYKTSQYLRPDEISRLSKELNLSDIRIKIWFQNRRAREKRENGPNLNNRDKNRLSEPQ